MNTLFQNIFKSLPLPVIICLKSDRSILFANSEACFLTGRVSDNTDKPGKFSKNDRLEDFLPCFRTSDISALWDILESKETVADFALDILNTRNKNENTSLTLFLHAHTLRIGNEPELVVLSCLPVSSHAPASRCHAGDDSARCQEILRTVLDNLKEVIYVSDFKTHEILYANKYVRETLAERKDGDDFLPEVEGRPCWEVLQRKQEMCEFCPKPRLLDKNGQPLEPITWERKNTFSDKCFLITDAAIRWIDGRYVHMESARDISDLKQKEKKLQEKAGELCVAASMDALTEIYNRQMGGVLLEEAYKRVGRTRKAAALCFLDLDGLKRVNDTLGHRKGDHMLLTFVEIVKTVIRSADIFCRWGGDEFILLLEDCTISRAEEYAIRRIEAGIKEYNAALMKTKTSSDCFLSFSYGLEEISPDGGQTLDQVIASADKKMYGDKTEKKNQQPSPFYSPKKTDS